MSKDYAKDIFTSKRKSSEKKRGNPVLAVLLVALLVGVGVFFGFAHNREKVSMLAEKVKAAFKHSNVAKKENAQTTLAANQNQEVHFDFYTELPNVKVATLVNTNPSAVMSQKTLPKADAKTIIDQTKNVVATSKQYFLLLGFFKTQAQASQFRLSLLLSGVDAEMIKTPAAFEVHQGSFATMAQAQIALRKLEKKGISGEVKKAD